MNEIKAKTTSTSVPRGSTSVLACIRFSTRALGDLGITSPTSLNTYLLCLCSYFPVSFPEWVCDSIVQYIQISHLILPVKSRQDKVVKNSTGGQSCIREKAQTGGLEYGTY